MNIVRKTHDELFAEYGKALDAVSRLGVRWEGKRLDDYRQILDESTRWEVPKRFTPEEEPKRLLFVEANSQAEQLIGASKMWHELSLRPLVAMLEKIVEGPALPPEEHDDQPRNTLLELSAARYLTLVGFEVEITEKEQDALASAAGFEFAVECKRPAVAHRLTRNLNRICEQLRDRHDPNRPRIGYAVVGWDRIAGLAKGGRVYKTYRELEAEVFQLQEDASKDITATAGKIGLAEVAALGAVIITAPVYVEEGNGMSIAVEQVAAFALNRKPETQAVVAAIGALYKAAPKP